MTADQVASCAAQLESWQSVERHPTKQLSGVPPDSGRLLFSTWITDPSVLETLARKAKAQRSHHFKAACSLAHGSRYDPSYRSLLAVIASVHLAVDAFFGAAQRGEVAILENEKVEYKVVNPSRLAPEVLEQIEIGPSFIVERDDLAIKIDESDSIGVESRRDQSSPIRAVGGKPTGFESRWKYNELVTGEAVPPLKRPASKPRLVGMPSKRRKFTLLDSWNFELLDSFREHRILLSGYSRRTTVVLIGGNYRFREHICPYFQSGGIF